MPPGKGLPTVTRLGSRESRACPSSVLPQPLRNSASAASGCSGVGQLQLVTPRWSATLLQLLTEQEGAEAASRRFTAPRTSSPPTPSTAL